LAESEWSFGEIVLVNLVFGFFYKVDNRLSLVDLGLRMGV
jgi:hypothetical protein